MFFANNIIFAHYRYHACAVFKTGRLLCWGGFEVSFGQLGTSAPIEAVASSLCVEASCLAVSLADFVVFSDNQVAVSQVSTAEPHTCGIQSL